MLVIGTDVVAGPIRTKKIVREASGRSGTAEVEGFDLWKNEVDARRGRERVSTPSEVFGCGGDTESVHTRWRTHSSPIAPDQRR